MHGFCDSGNKGGFRVGPATPTPGSVAALIYIYSFRYVCPPGMEADHAPEGAAAEAAVGAIADVEMKSSEEEEEQEQEEGKVIFGI